jgi:hypothetical protein
VLASVGGSPEGDGCARASPHRHAIESTIHKCSRDDFIGLG